MMEGIGPVDMGVAAAAPSLATTYSTARFVQSLFSHRGPENAVRNPPVIGIRQEDLDDYKKYLRELKGFQRDVLKKNDSFEYFDIWSDRYEALFNALRNGLLADPLHKVDEDLLRYSNDLMNDLVMLKDNIRALEGESKRFYPAACEAWTAFAQLVPVVLLNSRTEAGFLQREKKLDALSEAIKKTVAFVQNPENPAESNELLQTVKKMRSEIEGSFLSREENRFWAGAVGALGFLAGLSAYVASCMFLPMSSTVGFLAGMCAIGFMIYCGKMVYRAMWPDESNADGLRKEKACSKKAAVACTRFATLFAPKNNRREAPASGAVRSSVADCSRLPSVVPGLASYR